MRYLLDTNTCIAAMRHDALVLQRMAAVAPTECAISTITTYELYTGIEKCAAPAKELAKVNLLLATVSELGFDEQAAREAARIRALLESQGCMIGAYDVLWRVMPGPLVLRWSAPIRESSAGCPH